MKDKRRVDSLFKKAVELHQSSEHDRALDLYREVIRLDPKHFDALQLLATLLANANQVSESLELFARAVNVNNKNSKVLNNYGYVLALSGDLTLAQKMYERALKLDPNYLDALNNLANLFQQLGQFEHSVVLYDRVNQLDSSYVQAYFNKGIALQRLSKLGEALSSYDQAIRLKPDYYDAYLNQATVLRDLGEHQAALSIYRNLLTSLQGPATFDVHNNCGNLLQKMGMLEDALAHFDQAVLANPYQAITYSNRGNVLQRLGRNEEAILSYGVAITLDAKCSDYYNNRGNALQNTLSLDLALGDYLRAIEMSPGQALAYYNRGNLYKIQKKLDLALESYSLALRIDPGYADAHNNLGNILKDLNQLGPAKSAYELALKFNPYHLDAINNKGVTLQRLLDLEGAVTCFDKAIQLNPSSIKPYVNKAIVLFLQGKFSEAWSLYQLRLGDPDLIAHPLNTVKPLLSDLKKLTDLNSDHHAQARLLIWSEQGVGDAVMFASMLASVQVLVKELIVTVDRRLIPLFERSFPNICFVDKDVQVDPTRYDFHLPMGNLGLVLEMDETKIKTLPNAYLKTNPKECEALKLQLSEQLRLRQKEAPEKSILCGISWQSNNPSNGADRTIDAQHLLEALRVDGVSFVNLQYTPPAASDTHIESKAQTNRLEETGLITTDVDNYEELDRLAALISACDVVISIDNSTVHLSAAQGKPTWVLLPVMPDWRWMLGRSDSPWYASVELFRQKSWADWGPTLETLKQKLAHLVQKSHSSLP